MSNVTHKTGQSKTLNSDGTLQAPCGRTCLENVEIHLGQGVTEVLAQPSVLYCRHKTSSPCPEVSHHPIISYQRTENSHTLRKKGAIFVRKNKQKQTAAPAEK